VLWRSSDRFYVHSGNPVPRGDCEHFLVQNNTTKQEPHVVRVFKQHCFVLQALLVLVPPFPLPPTRSIADMAPKCEPLCFFSDRFVVFPLCHRLVSYTCSITVLQTLLHNVPPPPSQSTSTQSYSRRTWISAAPT
jgi:hypothetical protein